MKLAAVLVLLCWLVGWIEIASEGNSFWARMIAAAKRRAKEIL